jgi:hypothetical protein
MNRHMINDQSVTRMQMIVLFYISVSVQQWFLFCLNFAVEITSIVDKVEMNVWNVS